jgi:hypothetical protein
MALGLALVVATSCREQQSFVVVTVKTVDTNTSIMSVSDLVVTVTNEPNLKVLTYPAPNHVPFTISSTPDPVSGKVGKTLSVSFTSGRSGQVNVDVAARDAGRCTIGHGMNSTQIKSGGVGSVVVSLAPADGPCEPADGGVDGSSGDDGVVFPGCDPAALTCGDGKTCAIDCAMGKGLCYSAGAGAPGSACMLNKDCMPGTQCFSYGACTVNACLKFCHTDTDCGGIPGSVCEGKVPCTVAGNTFLTAYHTCTFGCDPRGAAMAGCPAGLHCFVVDTMDKVDCGCTDTTRTKLEGEDCLRGVDCAPGLICNMMGTIQKCRKVCKRSDNDADCATGQICTMLTNDQIYGACLP